MHSSDIPLGKIHTGFVMCKRDVFPKLQGSAGGVNACVWDSLAGYAGFLEQICFF